MSNEERDDDLYDLDGWKNHIKESGLTWTEESIDKMWEEAEGIPDAFIHMMVARKHDECTAYVCVEGCCVIFWHPDQGNTGGWGPAGCPCDDLDDARGPNPTTIEI